MACAHKSQRYLSQLVLLSTTSHHKVMSTSRGPQLQFQLTKGWVATIDLKCALWVSSDILKRCCSPAGAVTAWHGQSCKALTVILVNLLANSRGGWSSQAPIEPKCLNIFHHKSTQTNACVGYPWNLRNPVCLSRQTALRTVSENDVWRTGRQWKKAICVWAKCRALMGCCVARAREIPISCFAGTRKLEWRWG